MTGKFKVPKRNYYFTPFALCVFRQPIATHFIRRSENSEEHHLLQDGQIKRTSIRSSRDKHENVELIFLWIALRLFIGFLFPI